MTTKFVIVGAQRTGSSALAEIIGLHPEVACGWEWTQWGTVWSKIRIADRALSGDFSALAPKHRQHMQSLAGRRILGYRRLFRSSDKWWVHPRMSPALLIDRLEGHIAWLARNPSVRIVHIIRQDDVSWLQSKAISAATGLYKGGAYPEGVKPRLPVDEAIRRVTAKAWVDSRLATLKATNPYLRSIYEDFRADNRTHAGPVLKFLGADPDLLPTMQTRMQVQSRQNQSHIENIEEITAAIAHWRKTTHSLSQAE